VAEQLIIALSKGPIRLVYPHIFIWRQKQTQCLKYHVEISSVFVGH